MPVPDKNHNPISITIAPIIIPPIPILLLFTTAMIPMTSTPMPPINQNIPETVIGMGINKRTTPAMQEIIPRVS